MQMKEFLRYLLDTNNQQEIQTITLSYLEKLRKHNAFSTPISSQATSEEVEGSETRIYDPERVMEFHERLGQIETELRKEYFM